MLNATKDLERAARENLWLHFSRMGSYGPGAEIPMITRGEGCYVFDGNGKRYLDALAGLFAVQIGYSHGEEIGQAALEQMRELPFYTLVGLRAILARSSCAAARELTPGDLDRVFFTSGGSEAVETAWKFARSTTRSRGERRWKAISRDVAYHGTTMGALSINGVAALREPFEPLVPSVARISNTNRYQAAPG